jgi:hypothetical protein
MRVIALAGVTTRTGATISGGFPLPVGLPGRIAKLGLDTPGSHAKGR